MKSTAFVLIALSLAAFATAAGVRAEDTKKAPPVIVDPAELVQPVPDPGLGLSDKYDGKIVRFTGQLRSLTIDKKTKLYQGEMIYEIVHRAKVKGKQVVVGKDVVTVAVTFEGSEKALLAKFERQQLLKAPLLELTVQGKGTITTDGSLIITDAVIVP
jgi:hypothetical protein